MAILNLSAGNRLVVQQGETGQPNHIPEVVSQSLTLAQIVRCSHQLRLINQPITINQHVARILNLNENVSNTLAISQLFGRTKYLATNNALRIVQQAAKVNLQSAANSLHITQSAKSYRPTSNALIITQVAHSTLIVNLTASQSLTLANQLAYFKTDAVNTYAITVPDLVQPSAIVLTFGSESITLRLPEIGDIDKIDVDRVQEQTRGGDLIIFRDNEWPITEILKYKFKDLTRNKVEQLLDFFEDSIGQQITLLDYQGVTWNGIILTPDAEVTCTSDFNCGSYDIEFEFQGNKA